MPAASGSPAEISYEHDVSVFPLAIPLLAGPGAITIVLLYTGGRDLTDIVVFVAVLLAVMLLNLAALLLAPRIMRRFGETGSEVLTRVLGVLLAALAVQFVLDGIESSLGLESVSFHPSAFSRSHAFILCFTACGERRRGGC
jgi:small neutral amino acid transporter SnatA (MarC family)